MVIYIWKMNLTLHFKKTKTLTVPRGTIKNKKIMKTNYLITIAMTTTKYVKNIRLENVDNGGLAEWIRHFQLTENYTIISIIKY